MKRILDIILISGLMQAHSAFGFLFIGNNYLQEDLTINNTIGSNFNRFTSQTKFLNRHDYYTYTPNGTPISLLRTIFDYSQDEIDEYDHFYDDSFPNATLIGHSTQKYNCHSYAWYSQSIDNEYWMNNPDAYYCDGSYEAVETFNIGDIICYFSLNNNLEENIHSGVVIGIISGTSNGVCGDSDLAIVRSKWGSYGLYEHRGDQCPFAFPNGAGTFVRYYRPRVSGSITLSNPSTGTQLIPKNNTILQNSALEDSYAMYCLNVDHTNNYGFEINGAYPLDVRLYTQKMQLMSINLNTSYINEIYSASFNKILTIGTYYFRVAFDNIADYGTIFSEITNPHCHYYNNSYVWFNYTKHYSMCTCFSSVLSGHVVSQSSYNNGEQYASCLLCNGLASIGFIGPLNLNVLPTSSNGSFVLPNGIVVLADEDLDAYLNGSLVFELAVSN